MIEILYHTLWETVHVFFEHRELGHDVRRVGFLYPFLGTEKQETGDLVDEVAASIRMKVADDARLRAQVAERDGERDSATPASAIAGRVARGGKLILFGNGGSATDANDLGASTACCRPRAISPFPPFRFRWNRPIITAVANDVGTRGDFSAPADRAGAAARMSPSAISTSGGSRNIVHGAGRGAQAQTADRGAARL